MKSWRVVRSGGRFLDSRRTVAVVIFILMNVAAKINGCNGVIFIIIDHNNGDTVRDGSDRLVQSHETNEEIMRKRRNALSLDLCYSGIGNFQLASCTMKEIDTIMCYLLHSIQYSTGCKQTHSRLRKEPSFVK